MCGTAIDGILRYEFFQTTAKTKVFPTTATGEDKATYLV